MINIPPTDYIFEALLIMQCVMCYDVYIHYRLGLPAILLCTIVIVVI